MSSVPYVHFETIKAPSKQYSFIKGTYLGTYLVFIEDIHYLNATLLHTLYNISFNKWVDSTLGKQCIRALRHRVYQESLPLTFRPTNTPKGMDGTYVHYKMLPYMINSLSSESIFELNEIMLEYIKRLPHALLTHNEFIKAMLSEETNTILEALTSVTAGQSDIKRRIKSVRGLINLQTSDHLDPLDNHVRSITKHVEEASKTIKDSYSSEPEEQNLLTIEHFGYIIISMLAILMCMIGYVALFK